MRILVSGILLAVIMAAQPATAQDIRSLPVFNERDVKAAITEALQAMPQVKCNGVPCAAPTPQELATPPVSVDEARMAMYVGAKSAQLNWCGLEWQGRSYAMMMRSLSRKYQPDDRGLQVLKMIHALQLGRDYTNLQVLRTCSPEARAELDAENPTVLQEAGTVPVDVILRDDAVKRMLQLALERISDAMCGEKTHCPPATAEEKANPPVSLELARTAMTAGVLSGTAQHCNMDWKKRVYLPFMAHHRNILKLNDRQFALIGILHGSMQNYMLAGFKQRNEPCTPEIQADLEKKIGKP
jgi:hypothetical protein